MYYIILYIIKIKKNQFYKYEINYNHENMILLIWLYTIIILSVLCTGERYKHKYYNILYILQGLGKWINNIN